MIKDIRNKEHHFYSLIYKHFKEVWKQVESQEDYNPVRDLKYDSYSDSFYKKFIEYFKNLNQIDKPWSEWTF